MPERIGIPAFCAGTSGARALALPNATRRPAALAWAVHARASAPAQGLGRRYAAGARAGHAP